MLSFDFVSGDKFRELLIRDYDELLRCIELNANKSSLVLVGSIIEAILVDYFIHFHPELYTKEKYYELRLYKLIDLASDHNVISYKTKDLSHSIRNYRNLIHPGVEIREEVEFDNNTVVLSHALLKILYNEIEKAILKRNRITSSDIFNRIKIGYVSEEEFVNLLNRLSVKESFALYEKVISLAINNGVDESSSWSSVTRLFPILKSKHKDYVDNTELKYVMDLFIKKSEYHLVYYLLFRDELTLLSAADRELILIQLIEVFQAYLLSAAYTNYEQVGLFRDLEELIEDEKMLWNVSSKIYLTVNVGILSQSIERDYFSVANATYKFLKAAGSNLREVFETRLLKEESDFWQKFKTEYFFLVKNGGPF